MSKPDQGPDSIGQEHQLLIAEYGRVQRRCSELLAQQAGQIARLEAQVMCLRARVVARDSELFYARQDREALVATIPGLPTRVRLARRVEWLSDRLGDLMHDLMHERMGRQLGAKAIADRRQPDGLADVRAKSVLCIGQDAPSATLAQRAIEKAGGRFLHHAGGEEDDQAGLEHSLAAADLVICQTGCVSHDAYWRVQDHCKRTGKQCVLVGQPQAMQLVRRAERPAAAEAPARSPQYDRP